MKIQTVSLNSVTKNCEHFCNPHEYTSVQHNFMYLPAKAPEKHFGKRFVAVMLSIAAIAVGITLRNISSAQKIKKFFSKLL